MILYSGSGSVGEVVAGKRGSSVRSEDRFSSVTSSEPMFKEVGYIPEIHSNANCPFELVSTKGSRESLRSPSLFRSQKTLAESKVHYCPAVHFRLHLSILHLEFWKRMLQSYQ